MFTIIAENLQESIKLILKKLLTEGSEIIVREKKTLELHPCFIQINNPRKRTLLFPKRGNNPFATLAETLWVLAGRNDMDFLSKFLPRAKDFSDNGLDWRAGYGPRLRNWKGFNDKNEIIEVDQIKFVVKQLLKDFNSRQAVISIWDPAKECTIDNTRDYCCSNWIHFMVRNNVLDCCVVIRSNDLIFGMSAINVYEFTVIQEIIANCLNINVGKYFHMSDSMHVYENFNGFEGIEKSKNLLKNYIDLPNLPTFEFARQGVELGIYLSAIENCCDVLCDNKNRYYTEFKDLQQIYYLLEWYMMRDISKDTWKDIMKLISFTDLKVACDYWVHKNIFKEKDTGRELIDKCIDECKT